MKSGELYDSGDTALAAEQTLCLDRLYDYNMTRPTEPKKRRALIREMFAEAGEGCYIEPPLHANWGGKRCDKGYPRGVRCRRQSLPGDPRNIRARPRILLPRKKDPRAFLRNGGINRYFIYVLPLSTADTSFSPR